MEMPIIDLTQQGENFRICLPKGSKVEVLEDNDIVVNAPKLLDRVPHSVEEFCNMCPKMDGEYYLNTDDEVVRYNMPLDYYKRQPADKVIFYTKEDADAFLALAQLRRIWHEWENILGTITEAVNLYAVKFDASRELPIVLGMNAMYNSPLCFREREQAEKFIECFFDLLLVARPLL